MQRADAQGDVVELTTLTAAARVTSLPTGRRRYFETVKHVTRRTLGVLLIPVGIAALLPTSIAPVQTTPLAVYVPITLWVGH